MSRRVRARLFDLMVAIAVCQTLAGVTEFRPRKPAPVETVIEWVGAETRITRS